MRTSRSLSGNYKKFLSFMLGLLFMIDSFQVTAYWYYDADSGWLNNNQSTLFGANMSVTGKVGIGTTNPAYKFVVSNAGAMGLEVDPTGTAFPGGVGIAAYDRVGAAYKDIGIGAGFNQMTLKVNGNVGIGTTTPGAALDVYRAASTNIYEDGIRAQRPGSFGQYAFMSYAPGSSDAYFGSVYTGSAGAYGSIHLRQYTLGMTYRDVLNINSSGNVGIGTTTPGAKLDIGGSTATNIQGIFTRGADSGFQLIAQNGSATNASGQEVSRFGINYNGVGWNSGFRFIRGAGAQDGAIAIDTNNTERVRIDSAGNVGIGTMNPLTRLSVSSSTDSPDSYPSSLGNASGRFSILNVNAYGLLMGVNGDGNAFMQVQRTDGTAAAYNLVLQTLGGNVGIGTTTPGAKLEVAGQVKITGGTPAAGKVLTSDAAGLATWQTPTGAAETDPKIGTLTTNYIPKWNGSTLANANIYDNGTNVGIGTTNPGAVLQIQSPAGGAYSPVLAIREGANPTYGFTFKQDDITTGDLQLDRVNAGVSTAMMNFQRNTGNVGIGTTSPGVKLEVAGQGNFGGQTVNGISHYQFEGATYRNPTDFIPGLLVRQDNSAVGASGFKPALSLYNNDGGLNTTVGLAFVSREAVGAGNATELGGIMAIKEAAGTAGAWTQGGLNFYTQNSGTRVDAMRILTGGNVGIGTTAPGYKLDVVGDARVQGYLRTTGSSGWINETQGGGWYMGDTTWIRTYGNKNIYQNTGIMRTDGTLQVGAGTTLNVDNGGNFNYLGGTLFANTAGNVGIGTAAPGHKLDVQGDISATTDITAGDQVSFSKLGAWGLQSVANPEAGFMNPIYAAIAAGKPLYYDEEFASGYNSVSVYNNSGGGTVTITREADSQAPNRSGYRLTIYSNGGVTSPGLGGFVLGIMSRPNATFVQRFRAKIPVGYSVVNAENSQGTNSQVYWLTPTAGTGKWEEYIRIVHSGNTGTFSSGGHVYLSGPAGPVTWYLASANVYEIDSPGNLGITDGQINDVSWSKITGTPNFANADTVDSLHAASFLRSDALSTLASGIGLGFNGGTTYGIGVGANKNSVYADTLESPASDGSLEIAYYTPANIFLNNGGGYTYSNTSIRAPIFYDQNDTSYYVDPNNTSRLNSLSMAGNITINNTSPTITLQDSDQNSAMIHNNSNLLYFLRGCGVNSTSWCVTGNDWPLYLNLTTNDASFGNNVNAYGFFYRSDARLKKDIGIINSPLETIKKLQGHTFTWKGTGKKDIGFIAQEVEKVYPQLIGETKDAKGNTYKTVEYGNLIAPVVEAIKELSNKVDEVFAKYIDQQKQIDTLQGQTKSLQQQVNELKIMIQKK